MTANDSAIIHRIETLACRDPGGRGFAALAGRGGLHAAAQALLPGDRVVIVTGFCIRAAMIGENDGLSGSLALADALYQLGHQVVLLTDKFSAALLGTAQALFDKPSPLVILNQDQTLADGQIDALINDFKPTQLVAIERPGSALDGHRYSMRGEMLDDLVPAADRLLSPPFPRNYTTIAIGDGGNELGLGALRDALKDKVMHGEQIFCATPADHIIPSGISNWGAYALVAALSVLSGRCLMRPPEHELAILQSLLAAGAVDGCTKKCELSVDGIGWDDYGNTLAAMYAEIRTSATP